MTHTRRQVLQGAAASLAMTIFGAPRRLPAAPAKVGQPNLGFSLYGMKSVPLLEALRTCAEIGYAHVEFTLNAGYPTEPSQFSTADRHAARERLRELQLELPCLMVQMSLTADDEAHAKSLELIQTAGALAHELVPAKPPLLETVLGGNPGKWDEQKEGMVRRLQDWAGRAEAAKVQIALKAHVGSAVNSPERLLWLLEKVPSPALKVAYDYSHFELQGMDLEESLTSLWPHLAFIHVKDSVGEPGKFQFLLPGTGRTDYVKYFSLLKERSYTGPVCVEVSGQVSSQPGYDPVAAARQCYAALSQAMQVAYAAEGQQK